MTGGLAANAAAKPWDAAFAADLHLAAADGEGVERATRLVDLCRERAGSLYLLGDVFDLWTSGAELELAGFRPLFQALRGARERGLSIDFLAGNRDFNFTAQDGASVGVTVQAAEELAVTLAGRRLLLLHGDQLLLDDVAYQRMKRVIRGRTLRFLARHLPSPISLALGRRLRRYSRHVVPTKSAARLSIVPAAVRERLAAGFDALLCGHVHRLERIDFGGGKELLVLPPFFEEARFVVVAGGALHLASLDGALLPLPAAHAPVA